MFISKTRGTRLKKGGGGRKEGKGVLDKSDDQKRASVSLSLSPFGWALCVFVESCYCRCLMQSSLLVCVCPAHNSLKIALGSRTRKGGERRGY